MVWTEEKRERQREYNNRWNENHREQRRAITKAVRAAHAAWLRDYKSGLSCIKCGFSHPDALDFHHRDPTEKDIEVSRAIRKGWSRERLQREIDKCDVLCANCHRILHASVV